MQSGKCNDELGGISESRVKKPSNAFAHPVGELFRSFAHPTGERQDGERGGCEEKQMTFGSQYF
jgi:hypothetical protein